MPRGDAATRRRPAWFAAVRRSVDASLEGSSRAWDRLLKWAVAPANTKDSLLPPPEDGFALGGSGPIERAHPGRIVWEGVEYRGRIGWIPAGSTGGAVREGWAPPPLDAARRDQDWALWLAAAPLSDERLRRFSARTSDPRIFLWSPAPPTEWEVELLLDFAAWQAFFRENADAASPRSRTWRDEAERCFREETWRYQKLVEDGYARGRWIGGGEPAVEAAPRFGRLAARIAERFGSAVASRFPASVRLPAANAHPFDDVAAVRLMNGWIRLGESRNEPLAGRVAEDVDRFGRFLELSAGGSPRRLSFACSPMLNRLRRWLSERPPGATPIAEVYRRFVGLGEGVETFGLTRRRVDLYLLCLVQSGEALLHLGKAQRLDAAALATTAATAVLLESIRGVEWIPPERRVKGIVAPVGAEQDAPAMPAPVRGDSSPADDEALRIFVESHRRGASNAEDDYHVTPFNAQLVDAERSAVFQMHPYWSKKPHGAIRRYIEHFTRPGDLVLDPFTGSGGVNSVASGLGRPSVGIDLSPAAVFIAKHLCTPHPISSIEKLYRRMTDELASVRAHLYGSTCHRCGGPAETRYVVWSQRYRCPHCKACVRHDAFHFGQGDSNAASTACPRCGGAITTRAERLGYVPVEASLECLGSCKRELRSILRSASGAEDDVKAFQEFDLGRIELIQRDKEKIPYWHPKEEFSEDWVSWRPNLAEAGDVSGFFTARNLWAAAAVRDWITRNEGDPAASWLLFSLTASLMSISKKAQHLEEGGGYIPGNYVFPPRIKERNVFTTLENLFKKTLRGVEELNARKNLAAVHLAARSARDLSGVPDGSIDYVFTDPPYSDKVPFGEFNFLWEVWLRAEVSWDRDEILVNPKLGKGLREWRSMLRDVARELFRVLKPGRWASICYHDDSSGAWTHLQEAFTEVGFILESEEQTLSIERGRKSWKQATTLKSRKRDLVVNFRKPRSGEPLSNVEPTPQRPFREEAAELLLEMLHRVPGRPADRLYDEFVSRLVRRRRLERHDFHRLLAELAEPRGGLWYARGAEVFMDEAARRQEAAAIQKLESLAWQGASRASKATDRLAELLTKAPPEARPVRPLEEVLPEYFARTGEGRWRRPRKDERSALETLRASGGLLRLRRFSAALVSDLPLAAADRPVDAAELLSWLRFASAAGWEERAVALFELGGLDMNELSDADRAEAAAAYSACRSSRTRRPSSFTHPQDA